MNRHTDRASKANGRHLMRRGWDKFVEGPNPRGADGAQKCWKNNLYVVLWVPGSMTEWGPLDRLMIRRNDGGVGIPWAHKQRIKNEIAGPERVAVEVFPAADELIDNANLYHLFLLPEEFPFRFTL